MASFQVLGSSDVSMEDEIVPGLYLGEYSDAIKWSKLGIGKTICVLSERPDPFPRESIWAPILAVDSEDETEIRADIEKLDEVVGMIETFLREGQRVLVYCGAGVDRSPLAVAWYLHKGRGMPLAAAYAFIRVKRPIVRPHPNWITG